MIEELSNGEKIQGTFSFERSAAYPIPVGSGLQGFHAPFYTN